MTQLEMDIAATLVRAGESGVATPLLGPSSGGSAGGGVLSGGKRVAEILVHTLNGDTVVMSSKVDAYKKVMTLAASLGEMDPSLLSRLCPDYVFDVNVIRGACLRQKERILDTSDPCFGLIKMRAVMDLPVWTVKEKFAVWFKVNLTLGIGRTACLISKPRRAQGGPETVTTAGE
jgi:hypothetical protein